MKKKTLALALALVMCLSLVACGGKTTSENNKQSDTPTTETKAQIEATVCTPEAYDTAVKALLDVPYDDLPTYDEVVELFGAQGTVSAAMVYDGYSYYDFTDGERTALVAFSISDGVETFLSITGDIVDLMF